MALANLPLDSDIQVVVDWLEYKILISDFNTFGIAELQRIWDTRRNSEDDDFENRGSTDISFSININNEIEKRVQNLGDAYPFTLSESGESLELKSTLIEGAYIYLFCLFLSHHSQGEILNGAYAPEITNRVRDYFQACSTIAAAGEVAGHSYSFGFPRPDQSNFLDKLKVIYLHFGECPVVAEVPAGASPSTKDDQIDVIAWRDRPDGAAGKIYLLGQVASGNNWPNKSILGGAIRRFHQTWFVNPGVVSQAMAALFMPYCVMPIEGSSVKDRITVLAMEFGNIHYRMTIPQLFQMGYTLGRDNAALTIERITDVPNIIDWVNNQITLLRQAA